MPVNYNFKWTESVIKERVEEEKIELIKLWCEEEKLLLSDEEIVLFLVFANNDLDKTKKNIFKYFKCRISALSIYSDMNLNNEDIKKAISVYNIAVLPIRTINNDLIIFAKLRDFSYLNFNLDQLVKLCFMVIEFCIYKNPPDGIILVSDMTGIGLMHLTRIRLGIIQKFFQFIQEGILFKIKEVHVLNTVSFIDKILVIIKPFIKTELYELIKFHPKSTKISEISPHLSFGFIPEDYGGRLQKVEVLSQETYKEIEKLSNFYFDLEKQVKYFKKLNKLK